MYWVSCSFPPYSATALSTLFLAPLFLEGCPGWFMRLLGFIGAGNAVRPHWLEPVPPALMIFMLIWLLIGLTGTLRFVGVGAIANGAHFGGLVIGSILGGVIGLLSRITRSS